jgi:hypothetical protein
MEQRWKDNLPSPACPARLHRDGTPFLFYQLIFDRRDKSSLKLQWERLLDSDFTRGDYGSTTADFAGERAGGGPSGDRR